MAILAPALKQGDTIGFFSPSSPATCFAPKRFERAKAYLQQKGFNLKAGKLTGQSDYYRSGSIQQRADELNVLIRDPQVRCIISTIGGNNSNALLPYIDYAALKKDPKIIIGYSDVTALLLGIYAQTGLVTFYGPALVASFGEYPPLVDETFASFETLLCETAYESRRQKQNPPYRYQMPEQWTDVKIDWENQCEAKLTQANDWQFIGNGVIKGRVIGGNLNTMAGIWGSPYMPEIQQGDILLLEDCLKGIETVERSFSHLKLCGVFDKVSAIILGKHELFDDKRTGRQPLDVLMEVLNGQPVPILNGFDSCHTHPMLVTPLGVEGTIDFDQQTICITSPWLK
ncbi:S66 family peptidase [Photobacterium lutimaris]|uniref:LD-carboxypeptidase n=1 Tax=Photobacterium lutimaris TaxID=388278 RepID=A0A2T3J542_9GAMM|nr:S66 peptidase family protein [Photobacterium lutimaris]PSU36409.1 LD-carboxypeptidase [Photobacterium lutimaris]TDR74689.1 microcin C7 immunity protein [Photobacterium lutimaris]